ncbi:MAG: S24/S26 family peptidase [Bacteroidales bacterium]|nr:S24/S26 family peptidase [Bacteroidales bacterium]
MMEELMNSEIVQHLLEGRTIQLSPQGNSMFPFIHGGKDKVLVQRKDKIRLGNIVLAFHQGKWILHRVYDKDARRITLMGDGNTNGVELVKEGDIYGTVIAIISPSGRSRKPRKALFWRNTLADRKILLKIVRKWNKLFRKQHNDNTL